MLVTFVALHPHPSLGLGTVGTVQEQPGLLKHTENPFSQQCELPEMSWWI